jgi:hypothetical protein
VVAGTHTAAELRADPSLTDHVLSVATHA